MEAFSGLFIGARKKSGKCEIRQRRWLAGRCLSAAASGFDFAARLPKGRTPCAMRRAAMRFSRYQFDISQARQTVR